MAFLVAVAAGAGAVALGASLLVAVGVGAIAAAAYDYVIDGMMEDISVDTMGGRNVTSKEGVAPRKVVYGTCRTGGTIVYQANSGEDNKYLHNFVVFSEGEVEEISEIYFNDVKAMGIVGGNVRYFNKYSTNEDGSASSTANNVRIRLKLGTLADQAIHSGNDPDSDIPSQWTADHDLSKVAYAYIRLEYSDAIYTNGFPKISAIIKGKHLYDPRKDSTSSLYDQSLGVNNMRIDQPHTWAYSNNSAICLLNYMLDDRIGLGESIDNFNLASLLEAINECDDVIDSSDSATNIPKYTCDGIIDSKNSHKANIQNILSSMNGKLLYSSGEWHIKAYKYSATHSQVVTEDMILGSFDVTTKASRRDMYNQVKGKFISEEENYILTEYPVQESSTYEQADGEVLIHEQNLPMTTNNVRAQRLARLTLLRSRMQNVVKFTTNAKGLVYTVGDNIAVTVGGIGYNQKVFEIHRLQVRPDAKRGITVDIEAKENAQAIYDYTASDTLSFTTGNTVDLYDGTVEPVTNLVGTPFADNDSSTVLLEWTASNAQGQIKYLITVREIGRRNQLDIETFNTSYTINLPSSMQGKNIAFSVMAYSENYGTTSTLETIYVITEVITIPNENQNNNTVVIDGTDPDPTDAELDQLAEDQNVTISDGDEVVYVVEDADGNVVDTIVYEYESGHLGVQTLESIQSVIVETGSAVNNNPFFLTTDDYILTDTTVSIANDKLKFQNANLGTTAYTTQELPVGRYKLSAVCSDYQSGQIDLRVFEISNEIATLSVNADGGSNLYFDITAKSAAVTLFAQSKSAGTTLNFDSITMRPAEPAESVQKMKFITPTLPAGTNVTWSIVYTDSAGTNRNDITLTSLYDTAGGQSEGNRKFIEIHATRTVAGTSIFKAKVTATYNESVTLDSTTTVTTKTISAITQFRVGIA